MWESKQVKLRDVGTIVTGNTPPTVERDYYGNDYVFIKPTDITEGVRYVESTEERFSNRGYEKYKKSLLPINTPCIVTIGSLGKKLCLTKEPSFTNQAINAIIMDKGNDGKFIYYMMKIMLPMVKHLSSGTASGRENVSKSSFGNIKIAVPPLPTQQKIADILSAYDDLIENNNRRIELLEQSAQQIYNEWFVRFRFPGYESAHLSKGIPDGWEVVKLEDVVNIGRGSSPRPIADQRYFENGNIPWIKIADATASKMFITETKEHVNEFGASFSRKLSPGSLILAASGTLGFPIFLGIEGCIHDGWLYFDNFNGISPQYLYYNLIALTERFNAFSYGAAIQNINTGIVKNTKSILPPIHLQELFTDRINIIHGQIQSLQKTNQNLIKQRNLLLPRLMSGKLEVF